MVGCTPTTSDLELAVIVPTSLEGRNTNERFTYLHCLTIESIATDDLKSDPNNFADAIADACSSEYTAWVQVRQGPDPDDGTSTNDSLELPALQTNSENAHAMLLQTREAFNRLSPRDRRDFKIAFGHKR